MKLSEQICPWDTSTSVLLGPSPPTSWLHNVFLACKYISGMDLLTHLYMLPHWHSICTSSLLSYTEHTDTRPTSPNIDPIVPGAWKGSQWSTTSQAAGMTGSGRAGFDPRIFVLKADTLPPSHPGGLLLPIMSHLVLILIILHPVASW